MLISDAFRRIETALNGPGSYDQRTILNATGRYFFASHSWRFRRRMTGKAHLVAGVEYVKLPMGCTRLLSIERDQAYEGHILLTDPATFMRAKTSVALSQTEPTQFLATEETDAAGVRRLALHAAPSTTVTNAYKIAYEAGWVDPNAEQCSTGDELLPIPDFAEPVFGELLEAYALGLERQEWTGRATVSQLCGEVLAGPLFAAAVDADARAVMDVGPLVNTAVQMATYPEDRTVGEIIPVIVNLDTV